MGLAHSTTSNHESSAMITSRNDESGDIQSSTNSHGSVQQQAADNEARIVQIIDEISPNGQLYFGPNFTIDRRLRVEEYMSQQASIPSAVQSSSRIGMADESTLVGDSSYETLVRWEDGEDSLLDDLLRALKRREEIYDGAKIPDLYPVETIKSDFAVPTETVELLAAKNSGYELRFQICTTRRCQARLYLQAMERDHGSTPLLEFDSITEMQPISVNFEENAKTSDDAVKSVRLTFKGLERNQLLLGATSKNPSINSDNERHLQQHSMVLLVDTLITKNDERDSAQSLATYMTVTCAGSDQCQPLQMKITNQKLLLAENIYVLYDIYGLPDTLWSNSSDSKSGKSSSTSSLSKAQSNSKSCTASLQDVLIVSDDGNFQKFTSPECVICMSEVKNTLVLPCRHLCLCSECAEVLRHQNNKCPICRQNFHSLLQLQFSSNKMSAE